MKKNLLLVASLFAGFFASAQEVDENGYTTVNVAMETAYAKQVYYKLSTNTQTPVAANSWDLAFQKAAGMNIGSIRVNEFKTTAIYQAGAASTWATTDVANESTWTQLYNHVESWNTGAFNEGSATYGWGEYNVNGDHHVNGTLVFVLKYSATNYKKVIIEDLNTQTAGGPTYTIKSSTWNGTEWSADVTSTIQTPSSSTSTTEFTYFAFDTNATVTVAPVDTDWDFVFSKYDDLVTAQGMTVMYDVTGALTNKVTVAPVDEAGTLTTFTLPDAAAYTTNINAIGDKWKTFAGGAYTIPEKTYYVKTANGTIYRMYFLSFAGSSTGALSFKFKDVTPTAGVGEFDKTSFSVFPNPTIDGNVTINNNLEANGTVSVYTLTGANVFSGELSQGSQNLNLSALSAGMYIVKIESGNYSESKKLIIK